MKVNRLTTALIVVCMLGGLLVLAWAATTGPVDVVTGVDRGSSSSPEVRPTATPTGSASVPPNRRPPEHPKQAGHHYDLTWLGRVITLLAAAAVGWLAWTLVRRALARHFERTREDRLEADIDVLPDVEVARRNMLAERAQFLETLISLSPRNGIVQCWARLESTAAGSGVARRESETPTEFVTRFLKKLDVDPRAVSVLVHLFHEARFSSHDLPEARRDEARAALERIFADLAVRLPA